MARRTVLVGSRSVMLADDDPLPLDLGWWAVLRTRVVDELTDAPPRGVVRITTTTPRCLPRTADDGIVGLVARPRDASTALVGTGRLRATLEVAGYLPHVLDTAIDAARRQLPGGAVAGSTLLTIAPPEGAPRLQFVPGRGVMIERVAPGQPEQFSEHTDPLVVPAANQVPIRDGVQPARAAAARVAGVPVLLPDQRLHRADPAVVRGRAVRQAAPGTAPVAAPAAHIGLRGVWWSQREVQANSVPPHPPRFVSFAAPLAFAHAVPAPVERCTLASDGVARSVSAVAQVGATEIAVHPWNLLNAAGGDVLMLEAANSSERELVVTAGFDATLNPASAIGVRLRTPLAFAHARTAPVARMNVAAAALGALEREVVAGDRVMFLTSVAGLPTEHVLRIAGGTLQAELRFARCVPTHDGVAFSHEVPLGADGSFELPALARVAQIQLQVEHAGHPAHLPIDFAPAYDSDNTLQVLFTP
jgi:hypothetical protein